ncbi:MAG TPA: hypothetical protein PKN33_01700 [Phycisphaerae bacterium]|nr:hypothetical protein [Phycisphaerae bacterium]
MLRIAIAAILAIVGSGILIIEAERYLNSPFGIALPSPTPVWIGGAYVGDVWFQYSYLSNTAGVRIHSRFNSPREDAQVLIGVNRSGFRIEIWKKPIGAIFNLPPLVYPILLLPYPIVVFVRYVRNRKNRKRFPEGHCQSCGYDLKCNESGKCPECGEPVSEKGQHDVSIIDSRETTESH